MALLFQLVINRKPPSRGESVRVLGPVDRLSTYVKHLLKPFRANGGYDIACRSHAPIIQEKKIPVQGVFFAVALLRDAV